SGHSLAMSNQGCPAASSYSRRILIRTSRHSCFCSSVRFFMASANLRTASMSSSVSVFSSSSDGAKSDVSLMPSSDKPSPPPVIENTLFPCHACFVFLFLRSVIACSTASIAYQIDPPLDRHEVDDGPVLRRERVDVFSAVLVRFSKRVLIA